MSANPELIPLYETDYDRWLRGQVELLRARRYHELDVDNLLEEIDALSRRDRRELRSRMLVLIMHLLKWECQPDYPNKTSWRATINEQRRQIESVLEDSPSLKAYMSEQLERAFSLAVDEAADETNLPRSMFSDTCPYTVEQLLDRAFFPAGDGG